MFCAFSVPFSTEFCVVSYSPLDTYMLLQEYYFKAQKTLPWAQPRFSTDPEKGHYDVTTLFYLVV